MHILTYSGTSIEQVYSAMSSISFSPIAIFPEYLKGGGGHHSGDGDNYYDETPSGDVTLAVSVVESYYDNENYSGYEAYEKKGKRTQSKAYEGDGRLYPQLNGGIFMFNTPSWFKLIWRMLRPLYPKRVLEKFDVITNKADVTRLYPKFVDIEHVPVSYGGECKAWPPSTGRNNALT